MLVSCRIWSRWPWRLRRLRRPAGTLRSRDCDVEVYVGLSAVGDRGYGFATSAEPLADKGDLLRRVRDPKLSQSALKCVVDALWQHRFMTSPMEFTTVISAWGRRRRWQEAIATLEEMPKVGIDPDIIAVGAAVAACSRAGRWAASLGLLAKAQRAKMELNAVVLNAAMSACSRGSRWDISLDLFASMEAGRVEPDAFSRNALLSACERGSLWRHTLDILASALAGGSTTASAPDLIAFNACMSACERGARWQLAFGLMEELRSMCLRPDAFSYNAILAAAKRGARWEHALSIACQARAASVGADAITYRTLMAACRRGQRWDTSLQLFEQLRDSNLTVDAPAYNAAIRAHGRGNDWEAVLALFGDMWRSAAAQPTATTFDVSVRACCEASQWEWGVVLLEEMEQDGLEPSEALCEVVTRLQSTREATLSAADTASHGDGLVCHGGTGGVQLPASDTTVEHGQSGADVKCPSG